MKRGDDISTVQSCFEGERRTSRHLTHSQGNNQPFAPKNTSLQWWEAPQSCRNHKWPEHSRGPSSTQHPLEKQLCGHLLGDPADPKASAVAVGRIPDHPALAWSCPGPAYLTRWKMRRSRVLRWVRESWSMTEYTPRTVSFLSWRPVEKPPAFRGSFYFFLLFKMVLFNT